MREFVDERLDHKSAMRMPDRAKPQTRHAAGRHLPIQELIRNLVGNVLRALDRRFVHSLLYHESLKGCAHNERLANDAVLPRHQLAIRIESSADRMKRAWTIISPAHV